MTYYLVSLKDEEVVGGPYGEEREAVVGRNAIRRTCRIMEVVR